MEGCPSWLEELDPTLATRDRTQVPLQPRGLDVYYPLPVGQQGNHGGAQALMPSTLQVPGFLCSSEGMG